MPMSRRNSDGLTANSGTDINQTPSCVCRQHGENQRVSTTEYGEDLRVRWLCLRYVAPPNNIVRFSDFGVSDLARAMHIQEVY